MPTSFPGAVDSFPRPGATTNTDDPGFELDVVVDNLSDALEAVETRVLLGVVAVDAGTTLSTARPTGAVVVYWMFDNGVDVGVDGANVTNGVPGDLYYVAGP